MKHAIKLKLAAVIFVVSLLVVGYARTLGIPMSQRPTSPSSNTKPLLVHVRIRIYGSDVPLQNVQIELYRERFEPIPGELVTAIVTNDEGVAEFQVEPGTYGLWLRALNLGNQWYYKGPTRFTFTKDQDVQLNMLPAY